LVSSKAVPPGGAGEIKTTFKTRGYNGPVKKTVTVETNDPKQRVVRLGMAGKVTAEVLVTPRYLNFGNVDKNNPPEPKELKVEFRKGAKIQIKAVRSENPTMTVTPVKQDGEGAVYAVALPKDVPIGRLAGQILIETTSKKNPSIAVPVNVFVQGRVRAAPQLLSLGIVPPGTPVKRTVTLTKAGGQPFTVKEAQADSDRLRCEVVTEQPGERYRVEVTYDPGDQKQGRIVHRVTIVTQNGEQESIQIPVYGVVRESGRPPESH